MSAQNRPQHYRIRRMVQMVRESAETGYLANSSDFMKEFEVSRRTVAIHIFPGDINKGSRAVGPHKLPGHVRTGDLHGLSVMRVLKQGFSAWYNKKHNLYGVFWDGRYRSMVLKDTPEALCSVAAYIDLNPVRAGICKEPHAYTWSGYGQATRGNSRCRGGLMHLIRASKRVTPRELGLPPKTLAGKPVNWKIAQAVYRAWLYAKGYAPPPSLHPKNTSSRRGFNAETTLAAFAQSLTEMEAGE